jgi:hypothetical protein
VRGIILKFVLLLLLLLVVIVVVVVVVVVVVLRAVIIYFSIDNAHPKFFDFLCINNAHDAN